MKAPKVRLYIRVRRPDGQHPYLDPVWNRNRTLRAGYALIEGKPEFHSEANYYLRFMRDGKRVWQAIGPDTDAAVAFQNLEFDLKSICLGRSISSPLSSAIHDLVATAPNDPVPAPAQSPASSSAPNPVPASAAGPVKKVPAPGTLSADVESYVSQLMLFRAPKTVQEAKRILELFATPFPDKKIQTITREDLLNHMASLKKGGLGLRTISNHITRIGALLRRHKMVDLLSREDKPQYDEREVEAYDSDQLGALFAAANDEERMLFEFFLGSGLREQEVAFCSWANVDFKGKVISVKSKPELGFRVKDKQERSVPIPDSLIAALKARKSKATSIFVFPGPDGKPHGHLLRMLQRRAFRAGLNCGECLTKKGKTCATNPTCKKWGLHKFRKTFATMHHEAGVPAATIQRWLGHSDLATTLRYLAAADLRSDRTRCQVNASFAALGIGATA